MKTNNVKKIWTDIKSKYSIFLVLAVLFVVCWLANENFVSVNNLSNISIQIAVVTILAFGQTILIIAGMLDLSSASVLALAGVLSVSTYVSTESLLLSFVVAILASVACNIINGLMITKFKAPPFIATLAMMTMARGAALMYTNGQNIYQIGNYSTFGQGKNFGIPTPILFMIATLLVTWYILKHTVFGRSIYAVGGNQEAANASGINVDRVKMKAFIINGIFVGIAGVIFMSRVNGGMPNGAVGYEFKALTAAVIGGTSFTGGIGTSLGTLAGSFIVGFLDNIMVLTGVNSYLQQIIRGAIIALAVIYDIWAKTKRTKKKLGSIEAKVK
ncbi:monosaccharide ABC transporter membrane protein, CUT2 family [Clostridium aceticum]|uniref:Monosaccharide ABC transporter membrane protein, CUT2 family n=1 Tax=Clostridium aceticum TaxID=84022 RepID=A0A0D8IAN9_9CLOT|nr:ABC transporter permease [Clostridium aceticum]AKL95917.1 monosaccharide ABC transporter membrane protein, CUT2 family [Clostridium aceticum]KJF27129.1 ribose ABC transporter permease [Clostridium aceticum]